MNIRNHLTNEIFQNISKQNISKNDTGQLLRDIRCLIEFDKQIDNFITLYFYCNWAAHPNIDRNKELYPLLEKINIGFAELPIKNSETNKKFVDYIDVVIDALDFNNLNENIYRFLALNFPSQKPQDLKLILPICENLIQKKIHYPEILGKNKSKKDSTILKTTKIVEQIESVEKFRDKRFNPNSDYSKPVIVNSLIITDIKENEIFFEFGIDEEENVKIRSSVRIH